MTQEPADRGSVSPARAFSREPRIPRRLIPLRVLGSRVRIERKANSTEGLGAFLAPSAAGGVALQTGGEAGGDLGRHLQRHAAVGQCQCLLWQDAHFAAIALQHVGRVEGRQESLVIVHRLREIEAPGANVICLFGTDGRAAEPLVEGTGDVKDAVADLLGLEPCAAGYFREVDVLPNRPAASPRRRGYRRSSGGRRGTSRSGDRAASSSSRGPSSRWRASRAVRVPAATGCGDRSRRPNRRAAGSCAASTRD